MRKNDSTAVGEDHVVKGDGGIEVLAAVEIATIERISDDFEKNFVCFGDRSRNVFQSETWNFPARHSLMALGMIREGGSHGK